jgi:hypothetical protein
VNLIADSIGKFCLDCHRRPWERPHTPPNPEPRVVNIGVNWGESHAGVSWLKLTDPVTGQMAEIHAKHLPDPERWLFNRLPRKTHRGMRLRFDADDKTSTEGAAREKERERQAWDDEAIARMKEVAAGMSCALCRQRVPINFITGLCERCEER